MRSVCSQSRRYLSSAGSKPWVSSFEKVLSTNALKNSELMKASQWAGPYEFSNSVKEVLCGRSDVSVRERIKIHNLIIKELTKHDFAVATIHLKEMQKLCGNLEIPAFIEVIKYNPGRVKSSWEILVENFETVRGFDEALVIVLEKLVNFDYVERKDGKVVMSHSDIARSMFLLEFIKNKDSVPQNVWDKLKENIIITEASVFLPKILQLSQSSDPCEIDSLSKFQLYHILCSDDLNQLFNKDKENFTKLLTLVGTEDSIALSEKENDVYQSISKELNQCYKLFGMEDLCSVSTIVDTQDSFERLIDFIKKNEVEKKDIVYAKMLIRYLGLHKGDLKRASEVYHSSLMVHRSHCDQLMYELFLSFINQAFVTSNHSLIDIAEAFIPAKTNENIKVGVLRALIFVNSKFNLDKCLEIFNNNMQELSREKNSVTGTSNAALLCEALITAHLRNRDRDFAHVVFEGGAREKIIDGPTAVKRVKNIFTLYGESLEKENFTDIMDREIERLFKTL